MILTRVRLTVKSTLDSREILYDGTVGFKFTFTDPATGNSTFKVVTTPTVEAYIAHEPNEPVTLIMVVDAMGLRHREFDDISFLYKDQEWVSLFKEPRGRVEEVINENDYEKWN